MTKMGCSGKVDKSRRVDHRWGVVLAGGDGKRLLPLTRRISGDERPKQFCRVMGSETLLQQTRSRVSGMIAARQTLVVLTKAHELFYFDEVQDLEPARVLVQPFNRGTLPAVLYALARVQHLDPDAMVAFFPSDHYFSSESVLQRHVGAAFRAAESHPNAVIVLGIRPASPEAEYGWIQPGMPFSESSDKAMFRVRRFWEKPSVPLASALIRRGCLWNTFIMVGRIQAFLDLTSQALPAIFQTFYLTSSCLQEADPMALEELYARIKIVNFSQDVLAARPERLAVLRADGLGWSDLGDPGRVISAVVHNGIQTEWNVEAALEQQIPPTRPMVHASQLPQSQVSGNRRQRQVL